MKLIETVFELSGWIKSRPWALTLSSWQGRKTENLQSELLPKTGGDQCLLNSSLDTYTPHCPQSTTLPEPRPSWLLLPAQELLICHPLSPTRGKLKPNSCLIHWLRPHSPCTPSPPTDEKKRPSCSLQTVPPFPSSITCTSNIKDKSAFSLSAPRVGLCMPR
jgi:hypothetical protein